jgi:hypothetical protein
MVSQRPHWSRLEWVGSAVGGEGSTRRRAHTSLKTGWDTHTVNGTQGGRPRWPWGSDQKKNECAVGLGEKVGGLTLSGGSALGRLRSDGAECGPGCWGVERSGAEFKRQTGV